MAFVVSAVRCGYILRERGHTRVEEDVSVALRRNLRTDVEVDAVSGEKDGDGTCGKRRLLAPNAREK